MQEVSLQDLLKDFVEVMSAATDMQAVLDTVGKDHQLWVHSKNRFSIRLNRSNQLHLLNEDPLMVQDLKYRYYEIVTMQQFDEIILGFLKYYESNLQRMPVSLPVGDVGEWPIMEEPSYQTFQMIKLVMKKRYAFLRQWILGIVKEQQGNQGAQDSPSKRMSKSARSIAIPQRDGFCGSFDSPLSMSNLVSKHSYHNSGDQSEQLQEAKARRNRPSALRKQSLDNSIDSLKESHISQQRNMTKVKSNLKTKQHQLNQEHLEKNRNCCAACCQF